VREERTVSDTEHRITIGWRVNRNPLTAAHVPRRYSPRCSCGWEKLTESGIRERAVQEGAVHLRRFEFPE
jgi:hypothetical protein